jgi:hypothetical protein
MSQDRLAAAAVAAAAAVVVVEKSESDTNSTRGVMGYPLLRSLL